MCVFYYYIKIYLLNAYYVPCTSGLLYLIFIKEHNKIPVKVGSVSPILKKRKLRQNMNHVFNLTHLIDDRTNIRTQVFMGLINDRCVYSHLSSCLSEAHWLASYCSAWSLGWLRSLCLSWEFRNNETFIQ